MQWLLSHGERLWGQWWLRGKRWLLPKPGCLSECVAETLWWWLT